VQEQQRLPRSRRQAPEMLASFTHCERRRTARLSMPIHLLQPQ
jgi:hypothetical protein